MDAIDQIVLFRGIERVLIILFSGLSLVLGWHLFKTGVLTEQQGEFKAGGIGIRLQRVGPGVFFALFGVIVFFHSLSSPFNFEIKGSGTVDRSIAEEGTPSVVGTYLLTHKNEAQDFAKSVNTIMDIYAITKSGISDNDKRLLRIAFANLEIERNLMVESIFGRKSLELWNEKGNDFLINSANVDQHSRQILRTLEPWMASSLK